MTCGGHSRTVLLRQSRPTHLGKVNSISHLSQRLCPSIVVVQRLQNVPQVVLLGVVLPPPVLGVGGDRDGSPIGVGPAVQEGVLHLEPCQAFGVLWRRIVTADADARGPDGLEQGLEGAQQGGGVSEVGLIIGGIRRGLLETVALQDGGVQAALGGGDAVLLHPEGGLQQVVDVDGSSQGVLHVGAVGQGGRSGVAIDPPIVFVGLGIIGVVPRRGEDGRGIIGMDEQVLHLVPSQVVVARVIVGHSLDGGLHFAKVKGSAAKAGAVKLFHIVEQIGIAGDQGIPLGLGKGRPHTAVLGGGIQHALNVGNITLSVVPPVAVVVRRGAGIALRGGGGSAGVQDHVLELVPVGLGIGGLKGRIGSFHRGLEVAEAAKRLPFLGGVATEVVGQGDPVGIGGAGIGSIGGSVGIKGILQSIQLGLPGAGVTIGGLGGGGIGGIRKSVKEVAVGIGGIAVVKLAGDRCRPIIPPVVVLGCARGVAQVRQDLLLDVVPAQRSSAAQGGDGCSQGALKLGQSAERRTVIVLAQVSQAFKVGDEVDVVSMAPGGVDEIIPVLRGGGGGVGALLVQMAPGQAQGLAQVGLRVVDGGGGAGLPLEDIALELMVGQLGIAVLLVPEALVAGAVVVELLSQVGGVAEVLTHLTKFRHGRSKLSSSHPEVGILEGTLRDILLHDGICILVLGGQAHELVQGALQHKAPGAVPVLIGSVVPDVGFVALALHVVVVVVQGGAAHGAGGVVVRALGTHVLIGRISLFYIVIHLVVPGGDVQGKGHDVAVGHLHDGVEALILVKIGGGIVRVGDVVVQSQGHAPADVVYPQVVKGGILTDAGAADPRHPHQHPAHNIGALQGNIHGKGAAIHSGRAVGLVIIGLRDHAVGICIVRQVFTRLVDCFQEYGALGKALLQVGKGKGGLGVGGIGDLGNTVGNGFITAQGGAVEAVQLTPAHGGPGVLVVVYGALRPAIGVGVLHVPVGVGGGVAVDVLRILLAPLGLGPVPRVVVRLVLRQGRLVGIGVAGEVLLLGLHLVKRLGVGHGALEKDVVQLVGQGVLVPLGHAIDLVYNCIRAVGLHGTVCVEGHGLGSRVLAAVAVYARQRRHYSLSRCAVAFGAICRIIQVIGGVFAVGVCAVSVIVVNEMLRHVVAHQATDVRVLGDHLGTQ